MNLPLEMTDTVAELVNRSIFFWEHTGLCYFNRTLSNRGLLGRFLVGGYAGISNTGPPSPHPRREATVGLTRGTTTKINCRRDAIP